MPIEPKLKKTKTTNQNKICERCLQVKDIGDFAFTRSPFFSDQHIGLCNDCVTKYLKDNGFSWEAVDDVCRWADIPFIVREWTRLKDLNSDSTIWKVYSTVFAGQEYEGLGWADYNNQYKKLQEFGLIEEEIPLVREKKYQDLRRKWGANYDDEELNYLEDLYKGLLISQNVNGALQIDQAQKICKLSLEIDSRIRVGDKDVDKFLSSYDKLVKTAEFTPKNTKNAADFDSFAELALWLEKRGRQNKFYDGATRDVIDETLKNVENYNQRLYINEGGIGEEITERINALHVTQDQDSFYDTQKEYDLDEYDNAGYNFELDDSFNVDIDEEGDE